MAKIVIPEVVTYECDRCKSDVPGGAFKAWIRLNKKDLGLGATDDIREYELCSSCMTGLASWWRS